MLQESGIVIELVPPDAQGQAWAWVQTERRSSCSGCAQQGCGVNALSYWFDRKTIRVRALNPIAAEVGEQVTLGLDEAAFVRASVGIYLLPLLLLFGAAGMADWLWPEPEWPAIIAGAIGLATGFWLLRRAQGRIAANPAYQAKILTKQSAPVRLWRRYELMD